MTPLAVMLLFLALSCTTDSISQRDPDDHTYLPTHNYNFNFNNRNKKMNSRTKHLYDEQMNNLYQHKENIKRRKTNAGTKLDNIFVTREYNFKVNDKFNDKKHSEVNVNSIEYTNDRFKLRSNTNNNDKKIEIKAVKGVNEIEVKSVKQNIFQDNISANDFIIKSRMKRQDQDDTCYDFAAGKEKTQLSHPKIGQSDVYAKNTDCVTVINGTEGVIQLTFVDMFHIEDHPDCAYDYLEIRDGIHGYAHLLAKLCGEAFPAQIRSTGPNLWLKFHSDDTIEYEGFHINVAFINSASSHTIPPSCYMDLTEDNGVIDSAAIDADCLSKSSQQALDVLWSIRTAENTKIYLNFTSYQLDKPNECEENVVQVFGSVLEYPARLAHYCGSMANAVTTKGGEPGKDEKGNVMYVRLYASKAAKRSAFNATYTAYRTLDPNKDEKCTEDEFDCEDNTCIASKLMCDKYAHCRLKADEDVELCKVETQSMIKQTHIIVILVIFSLILSGMSFVFFFKCIKKLYEDHKIIKEHIRQSCEDRLDTLLSSQLSLDPTRLRAESEPRASLERENHANEMYKRQRNFSQHKPTSIESDIQEVQIDIEEPWRRELSELDETVERRRKSDLSRREESLRSKRSAKSRSNRDVSVGAPDTKEEGCQTRESLFQCGQSEGTTSSSSRGFSTFGYSGATLARPSPTPQTTTSEITIELKGNVPPHDTHIKKIPDRRPMSNETTRSAPDVIIVSKPIR